MSGEVETKALEVDRLQLIKKLIRGKGFKLTRPRKLILEHFLESDRHLTVEEIYQRLESTKIGIATVYRNVKLFHNMGIINEILVDGVAHYELKIYSKKALHLHFQCMECDDLIDIHDKELTMDYLKLNRSIEDKMNLEIYDAKIMYIGLCEKCKDKR
ncbi:MAG: Fur family transcriptional regulator [Tissierellaceae bacterium]|jgi:Fur family ferric uptake transcriptional regulator|nr:transcriptional repressor [Tissierellia bacterium]